jgi:hypothetical protein
MASPTTTTDFVTLVAEEIVSGIDHALEYWLWRIERELTCGSLTATERVRAIERVLREYKDVSGKTQLICASV